MKRSFIGIMLAMVMAGGGCSESSTTDEQGEGRVAFVISSSDQVAATDSGQSRAATKQLPASYIPNPENFGLTITTSNGDLVASYESLNDYDQPLLQHGDYKVNIIYGNEQAEGGKAQYFKGAAAFKVIARKTSTVSLQASLANSALSFTTSQWFRNYYTSASLTIRTESGYKTAFSIKGDTQQPNSSALVFIKPESELFLSGTAIKTNGVEVKFPETSIGTVKARAWHTITVDMSSTGQLSLSILLDDTMTEIPVEIELNPEA